MRNARLAQFGRGLATFDTTSLSTGAHTIQAVATDVSGATHSISQTFSR
jgi:hypothetical protein